MLHLCLASLNAHHSTELKAVIFYKIVNDDTVEHYYCRELHKRQNTDELCLNHALTLTYIQSTQQMLGYGITCHLLKPMQRKLTHLKP